MKKDVFVKIVTFVNKDNQQDTVSVVGDEDLTANSFEGQVFDEYYNTSGLYKAIRAIESKGHKVIYSEFNHPVEL